MQESLNVASYIDITMALRQSHENSGKPLQVDEMAIFGITKQAVLALRFKLEDGQVGTLSVH